uniref:Uncharacterized protein n=1 Tax=Rhizophora mucronata TaxID=61149 RepID=A0A2P2P1U0_RHIMU
MTHLAASNAIKVSVVSYLDKHSFNKYFLTKLKFELSFAFVVLE